MSKLMTAQDAIKCLEMLKHLNPRLFERNSMCEKAVNKAIKALGYRTPKKPNGVYDENESLKNDKFSHYEQALIGQCPNCNQEV